MNRSLLLLTLLLSLAIHACALNRTYNVSKISIAHVNRIKALATDSPTTRAIRANATLQRQLEPAYRMFDDLSTVIDKRMNSSSNEACSLHLDTRWVSSSKRRAKVFQISEFDDRCLTLVEGTTAITDGEVPKTFIADTRRTIVAAREALLQATRQSTLEYPQQNWSDAGAPYKLSGFQVARGGQSCKLEYLFAYRRWGRWYLQSSVTNRPITVVLQDWERQITHEYVPRTGASSLRMVHKRMRDDVLVNASTIVTRWRGRGGLGTVDMNYVDDEGSALAAALRANEVAIDLASDSVTASNIAILALPMTMSFIPVAFVADLEALGMLLYVLLTDVFAAVPFLIKGVELVRSSSNLRTTANAFHMGNNTFSQMEVWAAECRGEAMFASTGWVFIFVAVAVIVGGIALELVAARIIARRRMDRRRVGAEMEVSEGPFGKAVLATTGASFMGGVRERERADRFWREALRRDDTGCSGSGESAQREQEREEQEGEQGERGRGGVQEWWEKVKTRWLRVWRAPARRRVEEEMGARTEREVFVEEYGFDEAGGPDRRDASGRVKSQNDY